MAVFEQNGLPAAGPEPQIKRSRPVPRERFAHKVGHPIHLKPPLIRARRQTSMFAPKPDAMTSPRCKTA
jgi:hypothetical protein